MSRQITQDIASAFRNQSSKSKSNSRTDGQSVWLHDNRIIYRDSTGQIWFTLSGWPTPTTRERINGIAPNISLYQRNYCQFASLPDQKEIEIQDDNWYSCETLQEFDSFEEIEARFTATNN